MTAAPDLDAILGQLSQEDGDRLRRLLEPAWRRRQRELGARDEAIRQAAALFRGGAYTAAKALHHELARYLSSGYRQDLRRGGPRHDDGALRCQLWRVAVAVGQDLVGPKQLQRIIAGERGRSVGR